MISVILATRKRVNNVLRLWQSLLENTVGDLEVVFALDEDDNETITAVRCLEERDMIKKTVMVNYRDFVPVRINEALAECHGSVITLWGDDLVVHTLGWNLIMEGAFKIWPDNIGVVYCKDERHDEELCTHPYIGREWIETVSYAAYPEFFHYYVDTWTHDIAKRVGRLRYIPEVFVQHLHCDRNMAPVDDVYLNNFPYYNKDDETFNKHVERRVQDAEKLLKAISVLKVC